MNLCKKTVWYILWGFFMASGVSLLGSLLWQFGIEWYPMVERAFLSSLSPQWFCTGLIGAWLFAVLLWLRFCSHLKRFVQAENAKRLWRQCAVAAALVLLLAAGAALRLSQLAYAGEEAAFFDAALVSEGGSIPQVAHGAVYLYLELLHLLFLLTGNHWMAGIYLQIVLQLLSCVVWFFALKKASGALAALTFSAFLMLSSSQVTAGITYSPKVLYLLLFGAGLLSVIWFLHKSAGGIQSGYDVVLLGFAGTVTGFLCYADVSGGVLLAGALSCVLLVRRKGKRIRECGWLHLLCFLTGAAVTFLVCLTIDAYASHSSIGGVYRAWQELYLARAIDPGFYTFAVGKAEYLLLAAFLTAAGLTCFSEKGLQKILPFLMMGAVLCGLAFFHVNADTMTWESLFFCIMAAVAGIGVQEGILPSKREKREAGEKVKDTRTQPQQTAAAGAEKSPEQARQGAFIENPLPLPKKREKKGMDYAYIPEEEQMCYDLEISPEDDFDLP